jgi:hypothetical protein
MSQGSQSQFIKPGAPWQNGHAESFMARLRAECLDAEVFFNLADAKVKLKMFRHYYNAGTTSLSTELCSAGPVCSAHQKQWRSR